MIGFLPTNVAHACLQGTLLAMGIWCACRVLTRVPASMRCGLWWAASVKFLVGLVWTAPVALALLPPPSSAPVAPAAAPVHFAAAVSLPMAAIPPTPPSENIAFESAALWLWLAGVAVCLALTLRQVLRVRRIPRGKIPADRIDIHNEIVEIARRIGLKETPSVSISESAGPMVIGLWNPHILLPEADLDRLSLSELRGVLAHEMAHIRRKDLWWGIAPVLARTLFFFNPIVWLICREYELAQEAACDAEAVRASDLRPDLYGRLLLKLGAAQPQYYRAAALGVSGDYKLLLRRLQGLEGLPKTWRMRLSLSILMIAILAVVLTPLRLTAQNDSNSRRLLTPTTAPISKTTVLQGKTSDLTAGQRDSQAQRRSEFEKAVKAYNAEWVRKYGRISADAAKSQADKAKRDAEELSRQADIAQSDAVELTRQADIARRNADLARRQADIARRDAEAAARQSAGLAKPDAGQPQ